MKVTEQGQLALTYEEYHKTRNISFTELSCGHYIFPQIKRTWYLKKVVCPHCGKKKSMVMATTINRDAESVLKGK